MNKLILLFVFFFFSGEAFSQEPAIEMNDKALDINTAEILLKKQNLINSQNEKLVYSKNQAIYYSPSDHKIQGILLESHNHEIMSLVDKAKKNRKREFIGFAAIPLGITAAFCINRNQPELQLLKPLGTACLLASMSCIIVSPIATHQKTVNYRKAVNLYNLKF
jgi:hypothetical protein